MTDLVLVNPPLSLRDLYQNLSEGCSELPPLGICTLAAVAREAGYSVAIIDAMALRLDARQTHERLLPAFQLPYSGRLGGKAEKDRSGIGAS